MKYNVGDKYLFRKKNHADDGCMVEIEQLSDPMEVYCMVHLEGNTNMRMWVRFDELQLIVDCDIQKGDIVSYENRNFLYCNVTVRGFIMRNVVDEYGCPFNIPIEKARKVSNPDERKKFFTSLKQNCKLTYDKIMEAKNKLIISHIDEILRLLNYEVD